MFRVKSVLLFGSLGYATVRVFTDPQFRADASGLAWSSINAVHAFTILGQSVSDYYFGLKGLKADSLEYLEKRSEIHSRVANRILKLSVRSRGMYFKAGQHIGNLDRIMPREFTDVLKVLQDSAPPLEWSKIKVVLDTNLPEHSTSFREIEPNAIAAASLAQVHRGWLHSGEEVAVKLQYPFLYTQSLADLKALWLLSKTANWLLKKFDYKGLNLVKTWQVFNEMCEKEIDFDNERLNSEATRRLFEDNPQVYVPYIYRNLSCSQVLTMEFVRGVKINDLDKLSDEGFNHTDVAQLLIRVFARMIFEEGHVHCDPHPGNLLIRNVNGSPQLILLDHGFYRTLSGDFRKTFCRLWESLVTFDYVLLKKLSDQLGLGIYFKYLPLIFTFRSIQSTQPLGATLTPEESKQLRLNNDFSFEKIATLLQLLPPEMLFVIRTSNLMAIHNYRLGGRTKERLLLYTTVAYQSMYGSGFRYYWHKFLFYIWNFLYLYFPSLIRIPKLEPN